MIRIVLPLALLLAACAPEPIAWQPTPTRTAIGAAAADSGLAATIDAVFARASGGDRAASDPLIAATMANEAPCEGSARLSRSPAQQGALVWWSVRPDGRAQLRMRGSADTGWRASLAVDTVLARDSTGCRRPAAAVAVDRATRWVHVAYTLVAPEGPGLFYAHQMDPRAPFEPPRVIVYGDGQPAASVASDGPMVVIAFENPNDRPTVAVALSRTGGHLWEPPTRVSASTVPAVRPRVAVAGDSVAVGWIEPAANGQPVTLVVRRGRIKP